MTTLDDFYYQKITDFKSQEEKGIYLQKQMEYWGKENQGYSEYTNGTPNLRINPGNSVSKQLAFLKKYYEAYKNASGKVKGLAAKNLRDEIRNRFDLYELFWGYQGDKVFMNETLRDFLNTSDDGALYDINQIVASIECGYSDWEEITGAGANEHQFDRDPNKPNRKFINKDGREVVFTYKDSRTDKPVLTTNKRDKGTFNYAKSPKHWIVSSEHGMYDMDPYFEQFGIQPKMFNVFPYRMAFGIIFRTNDYYLQGYKN